MPELLITIFVFYLIYLYMTMKKSNVSADKPVSKANAEQAAVAVVTEVKTKQPSTTPAAKKAQPVKPALKAKAEKTATVTAKTAKPETSKPLTKAPVKPKPETTKAVAAATELSMSDRVGLTAGSVWAYLNNNGSTTVAKLVQALPEEEKIIQRSIGWLAQEGKIMLETNDKIETISLVG